MAAKRFVYILRSERAVERYYTGVTSNVLGRLTFHNNGLCVHTASGRPWKVILSIEFETEEAIRFERYLKSGSGCAFARRHFR